MVVGETERPEERLRRIYAEHGSALLAFATRVCGGDRQRAEDVVQEVLVRAWKHPEVSESGPGGERAWLITVTRNVAIDVFRAQRSRPQEIGGAALDAAGALPGVDEVDRAVEAWTIEAALESLPPHHRDVLVSIDHHTRIRMVRVEQTLQRTTRPDHRGSVERGLGIARCVAGGDEQDVALAQRDIETVGQGQ